MFCDVTDPENLEKKYARLLPGARNSTSLTLGGFYDDDNTRYDDDYAYIYSGDDDTNRGGCSGYSCGKEKCSAEVMFECVQRCKGSVSDCSDIEDVATIPACIESASYCLEALGGTCCTCPCYYEVYCCNICN